MGECRYDYDTDGILISEACAQAVEAAPCSEHALDVPSWENVCFPKCSMGQAQCNTDGTVTICSPYLNGAADLRWMTFLCATICSQMNKPGSGDPYKFSGKCTTNIGPFYDEAKACICE
jgi:hypothetical protein